MNQSPQIAARISQLAKELANGVERGEILGKYAKKWGLSRTSLDRYMTSAKPEAKRLAALKDKAVSDTITAEATEAAKNGLKSVLEVDRKLQDIIFSNHKLIRDGNKVIKVENTTADMLKAMDIYYRRNGHFAPEKIAQTDTEGRDIKPFTESQVMKILKKING